jgi:hypothetical protein
MKTREFREKLLVALVLTAKRNGLDGLIEPATAADNFGLVREPGQLRMLVNDLENSGFLEVHHYLGGGDEGGMHAQVTSRGVESAEDLLEEHPDYAPFAGEVPAAGRYVSLDHNQRDSVGSDLAELKRRIAGINDTDDETKQIALSEIAAFESTVMQPRVATDLIERFANYVLAWILKRLPDAVLSAVVAALVLKLAPFLD